MFSHLIIALFGGFFAGFMHVVSGPDHLAAVAPLAVNQRRGAWVTGFRWGFGHAGGVIVVGLISLLVRGALPVDLISSWSERAVGVMLIGIGLWGLKRAMSRHVHTHTHTHGGQAHTHVHVHESASAHSHNKVQTHTHTHAAFAVGTLHGLAGSSHFLGVLPALAFGSSMEAVAYLGAFGAGTMLAMMGFSTLLGWVARDGARGVLLQRQLLGICSLAAVGIGGWWLVATY